MYVVIYKSPQSRHKEVRVLVIERDTDFSTLPQEVQDEFKNVEDFKEIDINREDNRIAVDAEQVVNDIESYGYHIASVGVDSFIC